MDNKIMERSQVLGKYLNPWGKGAYCVFRLDGEAVILYNEDQLVEEFLVDRLNTGSDLQSSIYLSYSSVSENVDNLCTKSNMSLQIKFANPYRLHRVTNSEYNKKTQKDNPRGPKWYKENTEGVQKLRRTKGITVRGFTGDDWLELEKLINDCPEANGEPISHDKNWYMDARQSKDEDMQKDLDAMRDLVYNPETELFDYKPE